MKPPLSPPDLVGMLKRRRLPTKVIGAPPGTLIAAEEALPTTLTARGISETRVETFENVNVDQLAQLRSDWSKVWIDVVGLRDTDTLRQLGDLFQLHDLALEDVVNVRQRPKVQDYGDFFFAIIRRFELIDTELSGEQISIFWGNGFVITFQERPGDCFDPVRERLRKGVGRVRQGGIDYLAYALLDAVVDSYFPILEIFGDRLEELEEGLFGSKKTVDLRDIRRNRRQLLAIRRNLWPLREALVQLHRVESSLISADTRTYLRDTYDHAIQLIDVLENYRELGGSLVDLYLSVTANRTAEVSRVLTVAATVFIPLSFVAGVFGMNFNSKKSPYNMPELNWYWGYPAALGLMLGIAVGLLLMFRRRGWLGRAKGD